MKEVFSAVIPHIRKFSFRINGHAILSKSGWFILDSNGATGELVFRKGGELLLIHDEAIIDGTWEIVPEIEALLLNIQGEKKLYDATWGTPSMLFLKNHGAGEECILFEQSWLKEKRLISALVHYLKTIPLITLKKIEYFNFEDGEKIPLYGGGVLRTLEKAHFDSKFDSSTDYGDNNMVIIDWTPTSKGLFCSADKKQIFEVKNGRLWLSYHLRGSAANNGLHDTRLFCENSKMRKSAKGNIVVAFNDSKMISVPDGIYHFGWFTRLRVKNGRVV